MQTLGDSSSKTNVAPLGTMSTVQDEAEPLVRIIHLDCGAGGDCTVLVAEKQFIVIDGGKVETGNRLATLLEFLIGKMIMPKAFIISHFDGDHYLGVFQAIRRICANSATRPTTDIDVFSPASPKVLNHPVSTGFGLEGGSSVAVACRELKAEMKNYGVTVTYKTPTTQKFENAIHLTLESSDFNFAPSYCSGRNSTSLQWILKDSLQRTKTTYYTGGDSEDGPLAASIVKLDHHGSTVKNTNSRKSALKDASHWVIMGAGRGHNHPGGSLLKTAQQNAPKIIMTQHHFDDDYDKSDLVYVGRASPDWGDVGFSLYPNEKTQVNIREKSHLLTIDTKHELITSSTDSRLDSEIRELLAKTRKIANCPTSKRYKRGSVVENAPLQCKTVDCTEEAFEWRLTKDSNKVVACEQHGIEAMQSQVQQLYERREELLGKRKRGKFYAGDDSDEEDEYEGLQEFFDLETEDDINIKIQAYKKLKVEK